MRGTSSALAAFLATRPTDLWVADLFTITLLSGTVLRYAGGDVPVTFGGVTWPVTGPLLSRSQWSGKDSTDVPTMDIVLSSTGSDYAGGNIKLDIHNGLFDGAIAQLDRAIGQTPGVPLGTVTLFGGPVGQIELGAVSAKITVKGWMVVLQQYMPRNTYQTSCIHSLYDAGCTLDRAGYTAANTVAAGSSRQLVQQAGPWVLPDSTDAPIADLLLGTLTVTSGVAAGTRRTVAAGTASGSGGATAFSYPLYAVPAAGDTLTCSFGCDKSTATCAGRFANLQHNRSFPFIPPAEMAV
jgi:uncharacterized phage protein (TIGR02218 family)